MSRWIRLTIALPILNRNEGPIAEAEAKMRAEEARLRAAPRRSRACTAHFIPMISGGPWMYDYDCAHQILP